MWSIRRERKIEWSVVRRSLESSIKCALCLTCQLKLINATHAMKESFGIALIPKTIIAIVVVVHVAALVVR